MTAPENFNIDDQSIFFEEFPRSSFISRTARWGRFILYGFIVFHIAAIIIQFVSPFAVKSPDLFFQLLFLLLLWGMVELVSIPLESCKDSCQVDYQHHWISLHKNRFFYRKLMVLANFNQIQSIGVTANATGISNPLSKSKENRYAIVFQNLHNRLIRISDFNLSLQEANDFCLRLQSIHLPGAKLIEGEPNMEIVLEPVTGEISKRPCKRNSLTMVDEFTIPVFQSIVALIFSYFVFYVSFFIIDAAASSLFNTDLKIYQQPTVQLLSGPVETKEDQVTVATPTSQISLVKNNGIKTPLPFSNDSATSQQQYVSLNLDKKTVSTPQPPVSQESKTPKKIKSAVATETKSPITTKAPKVASETLKHPILPEPVKSGIKIVINATETEDLSPEKKTHLDPLYFPPVEQKATKPDLNIAMIASKTSSEYDKEIQPEIEKASQEAEEKTPKIKPEAIQAAVPDIDEEILHEIDTKPITKKSKAPKKERVFYKRVPSAKTPIPSSIPSINIIAMAKEENAPKPPTPLAAKLEKLLKTNNETSKKSSPKESLKTKKKKPVKIAKLIKPKSSRPNAKKTMKPAIKESAILPGYGMHPNISLGEHLKNCIKKLGKPSLKFKTNDGWQIIYKSFSIIASTNKLPKVKRINITKKSSKQLGNLVTPQGIQIGSKIDTVRDKYGPYTLLDGSPGLHFPHLGISFIPSPNNPKLVGAIEIYEAKKK